MNIKLPVFRRSVASRGRRIYRRKIQRIVDPAETGRFVVIDVKSGDYEVADRDADATFRLMARPCGAQRRSLPPQRLVIPAKAGTYRAPARPLPQEPVVRLVEAEVRPVMVAPQVEVQD